MRRLVVLVCILCLALGLLGGCANYKEMAHMNIIIGLAVDRAENGYALTFEAVDLSGSPDSNEMSSFTVQAEGPTIPHALEDSKRQMAYRPHYGSLETVVIHEDIVRDEGLLPLLDWCVRDAEMRETATLVISRAGSAREVLSAKGADFSVSSYVLEHIINPPDGKAGRTARMPLYRAADVLTTPGKALVLPAVCVQAEEEKPQDDEKNEDKEDTQGEDKGHGTLCLDGLAVFRGDKLAGYLEQERVPYYLCLVNGLGPQEFVLGVGDGQETALRVKSSRTCLKVDKEGGADGLPAFDIAVSLRGDTRRLSGSVGPGLDRQIAELEQAAAERLTEELRQTVGVIQDELGVDILALGYELYTCSRELWEGIGADWPARFPEAGIAVEGVVRISRGNFAKR